MPTLPWTIPNPAAPGTQAYAMASRFEVRSAKDVPRFFLKSLAAWRQVRSAPGCLGASLVAQPLRRVFYTLSAWQNRDALYAFAATEPHRGIMASLRPTMRGATFTFWDVPAEELPLTWDAARQRLAEQAQADSAGADSSSREARLPAGMAAPGSGAHRALIEHVTAHYRDDATQPGPAVAASGWQAGRRDRARQIVRGTSRGPLPACLGRNRHGRPGCGSPGSAGSCPLRLGNRRPG
jgi:hypothetical protein